MKGGKRIHATTNDVFLNALQMAREAGDLAELDNILDYARPCGRSHSQDEGITITTHSFCTEFVVNPGGSEGIYIDAWIYGLILPDFTGSMSYRRTRIGTIKTLAEGRDAYAIMGRAAGLLTYYADLYVRKHIDRFSPEGELQEGGAE